MIALKILKLKQDDLFKQLEMSAVFEDITKGRKGGILTWVENDDIPIVRSTTAYQKPAQQFISLHKQVARSIMQHAHPTRINNAMIEIYTPEYHSMGFHTDQSQDLDPHSWVCILSVYNTDDENAIRTLITKNKTTGEERAYPMKHNSVIIFDMDFNRNHTHKIILRNPQLAKAESLWLGVTFRQSKTYIKFDNEIPKFETNNRQLCLATKEEASHVYKLKGEENKKIEFAYPELDFTLSQSDLIAPTTFQIRGAI